MSRRKKVLQGVEVRDVGAKGKAIARVDEKVVFIRDAVPGDVVDVKITKKKKKYLEGKPVHFHKHSEQKKEPFCEHFHLCGGCTWQNLSYEDQLYYKEKEVKENLERIGQLDTSCLSPIISSPSTEYYRNKMEYTFMNRRWITEDEVRSGENIQQREGIGFHIPGRFDKIVDIQHCHLQGEPSNKIRNAARRIALKNELTFHDIERHTGFLRNLIVRTTTTGEVMVVLVFASDDQDGIRVMMEGLKKEFPDIDSFMYMINSKKNDAIDDLKPRHYAGKDHIIEIMGEYRFKIGPKSFFQTNTEQALTLYSKVSELAGLSGNEIVYDLYSGTGTIANYLAPSAKKVVGIESIEEATQDAHVNAELNNIDNVQIHTGDMKDELFSPRMMEEPPPDVIITDPPRAGMHQKVVERILETAPDRIVYVSCNPATQARDAEMIAQEYEVRAIQPIDMFPHTYHVENIILFEKK